MNFIFTTFNDVKINNKYASYDKIMYRSYINNFWPKYTMIGTD